MQMRQAHHLIAIVLATVCALGAISAGMAEDRATASEMAAFFHDDLAPYGRWIDHPIYGVVWIPDSGQPDWHPYWNGRWVWTTEYGWYWHSNEPYGWATYHYGRWVLTSDYGWAWVPGGEWGPAYVEWRYGDGYAGWAPSPPEGYPPPDGHQKNAGAAEVRAWIFVPRQDVAGGIGHVQAAPREQVAQLLAASKAVAGAELARELQVRAETVGRAASAAAQVAASAQGTITIYRPPLLAAPRLDAAAAGALNLNVPMSTDTEIDPDAIAKARAKVDDAGLPRKPTSGSIETSAGGTFGAEGGGRSPTSGASGLGVSVPAVGGLRLGR